MSELILRTRELTRRYGRTLALDRASLSVEKGQILGLVGRNGAGKTTLIRLISGQSRPTSGELALFGAASPSALDRARSRTGVMVETPAFYPYLTAEQNLEYYRIQRGIPGRSCVDEALELVRLTGAGKKKFKTFSLGMKQRLGLALALMNQPEFLLLDEPINGLDPEGIVEFRELLAPVGVRDGVLTCRVMELGAPDATGRRSPVDTGRTAEVPADTVITAVGEKVDTELYTANGLSVDQRGRAVVNPDTLESSVKHVFVVGDGQKGPGTVVEAIAGAAKAAQAIHPFDADAWVEQNVNPDYQKPLAKRGDVCTDCASYEDSRCLGCATVCETCTEVCPNRANVAVWVPGMRQRQIIHVDGMCNECGNCATFCPYGSRPYQDKFTLFWSADDFENSRNEGFLRLEDGRTRVRLGGQVADYDVSDAACGLYDPLRRLICAVYENYAYLLG